ncbi:MAG TPA: rhomboid family intramembrane serine protease [Saprospiraceae bacterium]|nr:rhomboid family intramembrane serine protease [Saprospiraceae bacterium]
MSLTLALIILTALVSLQAFNSSVVSGKLLFYPSWMNRHGEWYRFLTHGFVHANWEHLLVNMYVLYLFGEFTEAQFEALFGVGLGRMLFVVFYTSAIVIASIPSYFKHQHNPSYRAVGASGATSALVFAYVLFNPWGWFLFPPLPAILFAVGYLWYSSYMEKRGMDNIGHNAHFWGSVYGVIFLIVTAAALRPELLFYFVGMLLSGPTPPPFFN